MFGQLVGFINEIASHIDKADKFAGLDGTEKQEKEKTTGSDDSIFKKEKTTETKQENGVNGKLDEPIYQGEYGDCWLLSGLLSMSYTESGSKVIQESITANNDGSVDLYFEGIDKAYTISADELAKENKSVESKSDYSRGDDDALAIELGIEKVVSDPNIETKYSIQDGGNPYYVYQLYGAEQIGVANDKQEIENAFKYFEKNSDDCSMTLGVVDKRVCGLKKDHGYAVKEVTTSSVVIVDPWNSEEEITVNKEKLLKESSNLSVVYSKFATE
ncbi:MAG: hypothetical protein IJY61_04170 [Candidatus Gastranaerophilales bacterium]|nr:hypothetical protein [Candidatus Gastranaerophilales bacterium]